MSLLIYPKSPVANFKNLFLQIMLEFCKYSIVILIDLFYILIYFIYTMLIQKSSLEQIVFLQVLNTV